MPPIKTHPITCSFSRGEWSPTLEGRVDLEGYANSAHEITNWIVKIQGSLLTRGGWHFVAETKDSTKESRLIPEEYSELQNYIIELGDQYMRFYMDSGQIVSPSPTPYEIVSPYLEADIWEVRYAQDDKILYLVHGDFQRRELIRYAHTSWELTELESLDGPYMDEVKDEGGGAGSFVTITPSGTTGVITLIATPTLGADLVTNGAFATAASWTFGAGWTFDGGTLKADHDIAGTGELTQTISAGIVATLEYKVVFTISNWTFGSIQCRIGGALGTARGSSATFSEYITAVDTTGLAFVPTDDFRGSIDDVAVYEVTSGTGIFVAGHVGSVFRLKHGATWGRVEIDTVVDGLNATGTVLATLGGVGPSVGYMESCWSDQNGYPRVINFDDGRAQYASTYEQPQTVWASKTFALNNFTPGTDAADPYAFTLSTQRIIRWLQNGRFLCIGCMSGEATAIGPSDGPITSTSPPKINNETNHGSASLPPIKINKAIIFLQQAEKKLREFVYKFEDDAYSAPDLTILAEHMFEEGIIDMAYQQEPYSILWVLTADAVLRGCTYNRETNTVGWFTVETDGDIESIAVIPYLGKDQLWAIIKRRIGEIDKRYVEYLDWDISLDSALTYSGPPITAVSGLTHLIGKTVRVVADGAYVGEFVVPVSGQITLETPASEIVAGLPFTPKVVTSRPEVQLPNGTSQGRFKKWDEIWLRLINSMGLKVNGQTIPARTTDDLMGSAPDPFSGDFKVDSLGWDREGRITIEQTLPMSSEISAVFGTLVIGET